MAASPQVMPPQVSVIIPARNEEANLGTCLESLTQQGRFSFEIIVVDDHSTDRTKEIAKSFAGVQVIDADTVPAGWTGKNNALASGVRVAQTDWFLFTDADTVHLPESLPRALQEAKRNHVDMLSYSPEQMAVTFWEKAVLPVVFAELAHEYSPSKVSDPNSPVAAANGQYILIKRNAYEAVGGHTAIASNILEDVALARMLKSSGHKIRFRYAPDAVRTRMYRNFQQLCEGWTKNLALLFPNADWLATKTLFWWVLPWAFLLLELTDVLRSPVWYGVIAAALLILIFRSSRANFGPANTVRAALFGMPVFVYLLLRSKRAHARQRVSWKGRIYRGSEEPMSKPAESAVITEKTA